MKKLILLLIGIFVATLSYGAAPSSTYTYVSATVINPTQVQTNENNIYSYLQAGVDTYKAGSITQAAVSSTAGILYSQLNLSNGILPGDINTSTTTNIYQFGKLNVGTSRQGDILYDNGTNFFRLPPGSFGQTLLTGGPAANPKWGANPYIKATNTQSSGVGGGDSVTGSWQTLILNTKDIDTAGIASLSTNVLTIPAGTYQVLGNAYFHAPGGVNESQIRLYNNSDSSVILVGTNAPASAANVDSQGFVEGQFTITASKNIIIQYQVLTSQAADGLGNPFGFGNEVYAVLELWKIG